MRAFGSIPSLSLAAALAASPILACGNGHHEGKGAPAGAKAGSAVGTSAIAAGAGSEAAAQARFPEIQREELSKAVHEKSAFIVDANGAESYASGHIPGAVSFDKAADRFSGTLPEDKQALIVAYCGGPGCEAWRGAADKLEAMGYKNIRHYKGGIKEWKEAGMGTESAKAKG